MNSTSVAVSQKPYRKRNPRMPKRHYWYQRETHSYFILHLSTERTRVHLAAGRWRTCLPKSQIKRKIVSPVSSELK